MLFNAIACRFKKITRNIRDYGVPVTVCKIIISMLHPFYQYRCYSVYRTELHGVSREAALENKLDYRILTPDDSDSIEQIEHMEEWLLGKVRKKVADGGICLAALKKNRLVGFNLVNLSTFCIPSIGYSRALKAGECYSEQITVHPDTRKSGVGTDLRLQMFNHLARMGYRWLYGTTDITNIPNLKLSKKVGFRVFARLSYHCILGRKIYRIRRIRL